MSFADDFYDEEPIRKPLKRKPKDPQTFDDIDYPESAQSAQSKAVADDLVEVMTLMENQMNKLDKVLKKLGTRSETKQVRHEL